MRQDSKHTHHATESPRCGVLTLTLLHSPADPPTTAVLAKCFSRGLLLSAAPRFARALAAALDLSTLDALQCGDNVLCHGLHSSARSRSSTFSVAAHVLSAPRFLARVPRLRKLVLPGEALSDGRVWALAPLRGTLRTLEVRSSLHTRSPKDETSLTHYDVTAITRSRWNEVWLVCGALLLLPSETLRNRPLRVWGDRVAAPARTPTTALTQSVVVFHHLTTPPQRRRERRAARSMRCRSPRSCLWPM